MRKFEGHLTINDNCDYLVTGGDLVDLTKELSSLEGRKVHIVIKNKHKSVILYDFEGILHIKSEFLGKIKRFFVDEYCLDDMLWDISSKEFNKIIIEVIAK